MRRTILCSLLFAVAATPSFAQMRIATTPRARAYAFSTDDPDRAVLGVSTVSDGKRDTLGVLVASVTEGSPAERAGIEEGNRIGSVNGVNLKLSHADAGENDMSGVMSSRLSREMRKVKPGEEATLELWANGRYTTVKVKTVSADALVPVRATRVNGEEKPVLGLSVSSNGSRRDTLGVFVSGVVEEGPAEKAGISEGDRIASINGVDLRTPREDVGDGWASSNKAHRLYREIAKLTVGQTANLVVISAGRSRSVKVTAGRSRDLKDSQRGFKVRVGEGTGMDFGGMDMNIDGLKLNFDGLRDMHFDDTHLDDMDMNLGDVHGRRFDDLGDTHFEKMDMNFDGLRESLKRIGPEVRMQLEREMPRVMDDVRRSLDKVKREAPHLRARALRGVII